jgi:N-methylhydantoinase A
MIDIHTVGAGGGSIAYVDAGGALQVGPQSAGAAPGPACYGRRGMRPTVTDANLVLGRLDPRGFLDGDGDVQLDEEAARRVLAALGGELGLTAEAAALGVIRVANATMERALRTVSVEQGYDPRAFTLLPFGGAGPLHACDLAEALGIRRILCPAIPGVLSAFGMLAADLSAEHATAVLCSLEALLADPSPLLAAAGELAGRTAAALGNGAAGTAGNDVRTRMALDLRYRGQSYELTVPLEMPTGISAEMSPEMLPELLPEMRAVLRAAAAAFHTAHAQRYGYAMPGEPLEAVTLRLHMARPGAQIRLPLRAPGGPDPAAARLPDRDVWFAAGEPVQTPCYRRDRLLPQNRISGPALVLQYDSTLLLGPGWRAEVDPAGNLVCEKSV